MENTKELLYISIKNSVGKDIKAGNFGKPGERFISTRKLAQIANISLVTAQRALVELRKEGLIELIGKRYFLTYGRIDKTSPFAKMYKNDKKLIGVHVTNIETPYFSTLVRAIEINANNLGYRVVTSSSGYKHSQEKAILDMFREINVSGVLTCPGISKKTMNLYKNYTLPYVFIGRKLEEVNAESVLVNSIPAAKNVARHLIQRGYKSFAYLGSDQLIQVQDLRLLGFREGLLQEGYRLEEENIIRVTQDISSISRKIKPFLLEQKEPIGVFCFHDLFAVEVVKTCHELQIGIPQDVGIVGFDNLPIAQSISPTLTSVGYRISAMAETALSLLIRQITESKPSDTSYYIAPSLIVRRTTSKESLIEKSEFTINEALYKGVE